MPVTSEKKPVKSEHATERSKSVLKHVGASSTSLKKPVKSKPVEALLKPLKKPVKSKPVEALSKPVSNPVKARSPLVTMPLKPACASEPELVVPAWAMDQALNAAKYIARVCLYVSTCLIKIRKSISVMKVIYHV